MKNTILIISLILVAQTHTFSQVFVDSQLSNEVYFGPSNVYPISQDICQSYIDYFDKVKNDFTHESADELEDFTMEIDLLISEWQKMKNDFETLSNLNYNCKNKDYELIESISEDEIVVHEYLDVTRTKLDEVKWEKKKVNNCLSSNPEDCMIWCKVEYNKVYLDRYNNEIDNQSFSTTLNFMEKNNRVERELTLKIEQTKSLKIYNFSSDKSYSISMFEEADCN